MSFIRPGRATLASIQSSQEATVGTLARDGDATPEQIALFLPLTGAVATTATATCRYRVPGAGSWTAGHPLYRIRTAFSLTPGNGGAVEDGFAWRIIDLLPNTAYEVEVTVTDGAAQSVKTLNTTTRALERLIQRHLADVLQIVTPSEPERRGCQLSLRVDGGRERGRALFEYLAANGVLGDWREPDVIRISPAPMYNTHADVLRFARTVAQWRDLGR